MRSRFWLGGALLFVTLNMRAAVVGVAPVLQTIRHDTGMSATHAGLLISLPALCFGVIAPLGPGISRRLGLERTLVVTMLLVAAGIAVRLFHPVGALFAGTLMLGLAIGASNVVVPVVIKHHFPERIGLMTGLYLCAMLGAGSVALGITVPLMHAAGLGWRWAIAVWALPALAAAAAWRLVLPRREAVADEERPEPVRGLWRDPLAWQVTGFLGLQSLGYYAATAWVPTLLTDNGLSASSAGLLLAVSNAVSIPSALVTATLAGRLRTQVWVVLPVVSTTAAGFAGLVLAPAATPLLWMVVLGLGQGGTFGLALTLIGLRSSDSRHAAPLSGIAQTVGYLLAAAGPLALGALHDAFGSWKVPLALVAATTVPQLLAGLGAARALHVRGRPRRSDLLDAETEAGFTAGR